MELKRIYDPADLERYKAEREAAMNDAREQVKPLNLSNALAEDFIKRIVDSKNINPPKVTALTLHHTGIEPEQNFSVDLVTSFIQSGLMVRDGNTITLKTEQDTLTYTVNRAPGRYCLHCGEKLEGDERGEMARLHIAEKHNGVASPDPDVPAGYVWLKHFECVLEADQHAQYQFNQ